MENLNTAAPPRAIAPIGPMCRRRAAFTLMELTVVIVVIAALAALVVSNIDHTRDAAELTAARATMQTVREAFTGSPAGPGYLSDMKHLPGFSLAAVRMHDLLSSSSHPAFAAFDIAANRGWRGPYLRNAQGVANTNSARNGAFPAAGERRFAGDASFQERGFFYDATSSHYGATGDLAAGDPWGNPIVVQTPPADAFSGTTGEAKRFRYARLVSAGPDGVLATPADRLAGMLADGTTAARGDDLVLFLNRTDTYEAEEP